MSKPRTKSTTLATPAYTWPAFGPTTPMEVDDQAPIPLIVGIALALFIGFVIIICCICRRRALMGSSRNSNANSNSAAYQRAPAGDGAGQGGGFGAGNSFPMAPVNPMYPASHQGQQVATGQNNVHGGLTVGQQGLANQNHPYPSLPPNAYTPPYPIGYAPLPSYMPTSQSSHASSASGPSSEHGPSGFSSSPPAPAPAPTGMMTASNSTSDQSAVGVQSNACSQPSESEGLESSGATTSTGVGTLGSNYSGQGQFGGQGQFAGQGQYGAQGQFVGQGQYSVAGQGQYGVPGQFRGQGAYMMGQRVMGLGGVAGYSSQGMDKGGGVGQGGGLHFSPAVHTTAMDYVPGATFIPRVGSPMPFVPGPDTTVTELDHL